MLCFRSLQCIYLTIKCLWLWHVTLPSSLATTVTTLYIFFYEFIVFRFHFYMSLYDNIVNICHWLTSFSIAPSPFMLAQELHFWSYLCSNQTHRLTVFHERDANCQSTVSSSVKVYLFVCFYSHVMLEIELRTACLFDIYPEAKLLEPIVALFSILIF